MKRNIGKFAANIAVAGVLLGAVAVWADDQQNQQGSTSSADQSQQAGQSSATSSTSSDQSSQAGQAGQSSTASAGEAAGAEAGPIAQMAQDPQQFIKAAYQQNLFEVKAGQLAQQKAQNQQTKDFAQSLVQDHQQAVDQLKKLADQKNVQVSDQLSAPRQRMLDELSSLSGADFDKKFMNQQIRSHKRAIALYQAAAQNNTDSDVKQFAQQNLSGLQHHLQMAQQQGGISEPAGAQGEQGKSSQDQGAQGSSSSSSSSQDQSSQSGQSAQPQSAQPDQSGQSAQPK